MIRTCFLSCLVVSVLASLSLAAPPKRNEMVPGIEPLGDPIAFNGEFVEVTHANTLRNRYASKDFLEDLAFYTERAKAASKGRTPGKIRLREVIVREIDIVAQHPKNPDGKIEATCKVPESRIAEIDEYEKALGETFFAYSNGALQLEWAKAVIIDKPLKYDQLQDEPGKWWFRPKRIEDQITPFLADMKDGDVDFLLFFLDPAERKDDGKLMWPAYGGMAWGEESMKGAHMVTLNDHEIARGTHELGHHLYDTTVQDTENITITRFHGMVDAGYYPDDLWTDREKFGTLQLGPVMAYYRDCMRYFYTRDMWERWRLHKQHNMSHTAFQGKPYIWADVKIDYWFKLPQLKKEELRTLTGLKTLSIEAAESTLVFNADSSDGLQSPRVDGAAATDISLNNAINFHAESAAVLKTGTGTWLFVRPPLVDLYVDMLGLRGEPANPLPVYGYVLEDHKTLLAIKVPDNIGLPLDEAGFFRPSPVAITAEGLTAPGSTTFRETLKVSLATTASGTVRYTLNDSRPTKLSARFRQPLVLNDSSVIRAAVFGPGGEQIGGEFRRSYQFQPIESVVEGVTGGFSPYTLMGTATLKLHGSGNLTRIRYTTDGMIPTDKSPLYEAPIEIKGNAVVTAQCFTSSDRPRGPTWTAHFVNRGFQKTLTTGKPVTVSEIQPNHVAEDAVDGYVDLEKGWWSSPTPQWLQVDLQETHRVNRVNLVTYWDGERYYQYKIETSLDGQEWKTVANAAANTTAATELGYTHDFDAQPVRYIKVTMLKNSANEAAHVIELRAFEAK